MEGTTQGAEFSTCRTWRYMLWRVWEPTFSRLMVVGLNPSTADEIQDDPTVKRCITLAKRLGHGGLYVANLFAFRATDPQVMVQAEDPIGQDNDRLLVAYAKRSKAVVVAWGNRGTFMSRGTAVTKLLATRPLYCLGLTKNGQPRHPLYLPNDTSVVLYQSCDSDAFKGPR